MCWNTTTRLRESLDICKLLDQLLQEVPEPALFKNNCQIGEPALNGCAGPAFPVGVMDS